MVQKLQPPADQASCDLLNNQVKPKSKNAMCLSKLDAEPTYLTPMSPNHKQKIKRSTSSHNLNYCPEYGEIIEKGFQIDQKLLSIKTRIQKQNTNEKIET